MDSLERELTKAREKAGLSLKDVFARTRISVVILQSIEAEDFPALPVPIYTRNFIKTYAGALGVDATGLLQRYDDYLNSVHVLERDAALQCAAEKRSWSAKLKPYKGYLGFAFILIVFAAIAVFVSMRHQPETLVIQMPETPGVTAAIELDAGPDDPVPETLDPDAERTASTDVTAKDLSQAPEGIIDPLLSRQQSPGATGSFYPRDGDASVLTVTATEPTWIQIIADGQPPFEALLQPGDQVTRKAIQFDMHIGNAGGVKLRFQGKTIENLGKSGQVMHLRLP